jgi:peptidoglycan/LPS O-acetylase OafA/YrhL
VFQHGIFGVQLFFIVSGFCIWMTARRCPDLATFWTRRLGRIQPSYVAAVLLTFAIVAAFGLPGREVSGADLLSNLTWATMFVPAPFVDGVYWTLLVELKFYFWFGLIVFGLRRLIRPLDGFLVLSIFAVILMAIARQWPDVKMPSFVPSLYMYGDVLPYAPFFLVGIALYDWDKVGAVRLVLCALVYVTAVWLSTPDQEAMLFLLALLPVSAVTLLWPSLRIPAPIRFIGLVAIHSTSCIRISAMSPSARRLTGSTRTISALALPSQWSWDLLRSCTSLVEERARAPFERVLFVPLNFVMLLLVGLHTKLYGSTSTLRRISPLGRGAEPSQSRK